mmetsp:Transcript_61214/g.189653  ORF Transcript_61214/g.189653 Transcript_61214/m.189653 type:complete len:289 (+) Transcript_61214:1300-2166(+)
MQPRERPRHRLQQRQVAPVHVRLLQRSPLQALHDQAAPAQVDHAGSQAGLPRQQVHRTDDLRGEAEEDEVGEALDDERLAAPLRSVDAVGKAYRQRLVTRSLERLLVQGAGGLQHGLTLKAGDWQTFGNRRLSLAAREAHGDQPLCDQRAGKLGEHVCLGRHNVPHLSEQDVRYLVIRLGGDATLGVPHRQRHDLLDGRLRLRERPPLQQEPAHLVVLLPVLRRHDAEPLRGERAREHAVGHAKAVGNHAVAVGLLDGVGHSMAVLKDHAAGLLVGVGLQHRHLCLNA